jgi:hypothetical protein
MKAGLLSLRSKLKALAVSARIETGCLIFWLFVIGRREYRFIKKKVRAS